MSTSELVTAQHLQRKAIIYIRQSTPHQVLSNQESLRLQYALQQRALELGWRAEDIEIIDTDLGLTAAFASHEGELGTGGHRPVRGGHPPFAQLFGLVPAAGCVRIPGLPHCRL